MDKDKQQGKQTSISRFFGKNDNNKITEESNEHKEETINSSTRKLRQETAENWKVTPLSKYNVEKWLIIETVERRNQVSSLKCEICKT